VGAPARQRRYSAPFFFNPAAGADIAPLPCFTAHTPAVYTPINWGEFRLKRFAGDYKDLGEEVQISQYRVNVE
jgi:isopenicillin N synthase-like dioxygenase